MSNSSQTLVGRQIREHNLQIVRAALHSEQIATASRLKDLTGLSIVTLNKIITTLLQHGEIFLGDTCRHLSF